VTPLLLTLLSRMARLTNTNTFAVVAFNILWALGLVISTFTHGGGRWVAFLYCKF